MFNKLDQLKSPRDRVLELMDKIMLGEMGVESISVERFKSEDTGKPFLLVSLELVEDV